MNNQGDPCNQGDTHTQSNTHIQDKWESFVESELEGAPKGAVEMLRATFFAGAVAGIQILLTHEDLREILDSLGKELRRNTPKGHE